MRYIISIICLLFSISVFAENWGEMTWGTGTWGKEVILPTDNNSECEDVKHAFYSFEEQTITVPIIDAPIYDSITEEPTGKFVAFYALLKFKESPDRLSLDNLKLLKNVTPDLKCHAVYREIDNTLKIPFIDVPVVEFIANQNVVIGTDILSATLKFMPISQIFKVDSITQLASED